MYSNKLIFATLQSNSSKWHRTTIVYFILTQHRINDITLIQQSSFDVIFTCMKFPVFSSNWLSIAVKYVTGLLVGWCLSSNENKYTFRHPMHSNLYSDSAEQGNDSVYLQSSNKLIWFQQSLKILISLPAKICQLHLVFLLLKQSCQ